MIVREGGIPFCFSTSVVGDITTKIELGRSMVEMLGVLAIIGILSIGGIAGYALAMNRYKANQIIDAATKLSVISRTNYASNPSGWNESMDRAYDELELWGPNRYETTFYVGPAGDVYIWIDDKPGVADALESIVGNRYHIVNSLK